MFRTFKSFAFKVQESAETFQFTVKPSITQCCHVTQNGEKNVFPKAFT